MKKMIFFSIWCVILSLSFITIINASPVPFLTGTLKIINSIQRESGLLVFILLFIQIIIGAFMNKFVKRFGDWIIKFHSVEGVLVYLLAFLHPISMLLFSYLAGGKFDPYVAFINICFICKGPSDYYLTIGRVSFWILTVGVFAAIFKNANSWLKENWRCLHLVNYMVFLAVAAHGFLTGSDFKSEPFFIFAVLSIIIVLGIIIFIELPKWYKDFKNWARS